MWGWIAVLPVPPGNRWQVLDPAEGVLFAFLILSPEHGNGAGVPHTLNR